MIRPDWKVGVMGSSDISYCASACLNTECFRHKSKAPEANMYLAWTDFSPICHEYKPIIKFKEKKNATN